MDAMQSQLRRAGQAWHEKSKEQDDNFLEESRKRLGRILKKKFNTCFIGALDCFEKAFGHLWGHNIPEFKRSEEQLRWTDLWKRVRTDILNNGNNQIRAVESELQLHSTRWEPYQATLTPTSHKESE